MKRILFFTIITLCCSNIFSQDYSNKGKEFWIAYTSHIDETQSLMGIYITSDQNATGNIKVGTVNIPFTVIAKQITKKILGTSGPVDGTNVNVYLDQADGIKTNAAIKVTSDVPVVVYAHIIRSARSAATLVLPTPVLGTEYIVPNYPSNGTSGGTNPNVALFAVVATQPNTVIEFTPTINGGNGKVAGTTYQVTLANAGDCYQFHGDPTLDLSGTVVKSISTSTTGCKPIAVFAGSTWSAFDCQGASGGDNLYQELFPYRSWGKRFITAPFKNRTNDIFRIYIKDPTTVVKITDNGVTQTLGAGQYYASGKFYEYQTGNGIYIDATQPISVVQFITSMTCKTGCPTSSNNPTCYADPEMVILNPIEQTLKDITFFSAHQNSFTGFSNITRVELHFVNVIIHKNYKASVKIDGAAPKGIFTDIIGTNYSYLQEDVTNSSASNPVHTVIADTGFSAIVYGYGPVESYGYNGGTNVLDLYQYITLKNEYATVNFPATCKGSPINFSITLPYQPLKLNWDFGNNPNLSPNAAVINTNPVFDSSFVKDGKTLYVYKLSGIYTFTQIGTYPVKILVNNPTSDGCGGEQEISYDVKVYEPPIASFSVSTNGCNSSPVLFFDKSNTSLRPIIKYAWDFGDATKDSVKNPIKTFAIGGNFPVHYTIITDIGCIADTTKNVVLSIPPTSKFVVKDSICVNSLVTFFDSSNTPTPSTIAKWFWDFGNGKKDTLLSNNSPTQTYTVAGKYTVTLFVETSSGCRSAVFTKDIFIRPFPIVDFVLPNGICLPKGTVTFNNTSTIADNTETDFSYKWLFDNNDSSTQKNGTTTYTNAGPFNVKLIVTSKYGCVSETTKTLATVYSQAKANFKVDTAFCLRDTTFFTDLSNGSGSNIAKWDWNFGDGTTDTVQHPKHLYLIAATDTVALFITTDKGCVSDTMKKVITLTPLPIAGFINSTPTCEKRTITFSDTSKANVGTITNWNWNMGDGKIYNFTTFPNPFIYTYDTTGIYNVRMMVVNSKGCKSDSSAIHQIATKPLPHIGFTLPEVCLDDAFAQFMDTSKINDTPPNLFTYIWNFGDKNATASNPNISNLQNPKHSYTDTGIYKVQLKIITKDNCIDSLPVSFTVNGSTPKANFSVLNAANLCSNDSVRIQNTSTVDFGNVTKVEIYWDTANNLSHLTIDDEPKKNKIYTTIYNKFSQPATQIIYVKLLAYSGISCVSSKTIAVTLHQAPQVQFLPIKSICKDAASRIIFEASEIGNVPGTAVFTGVGIVNAATGLFNPAIVAKDSSSIKYTYASTNFGCIDSGRQTIIIHKSPVAKFGLSYPLCEKNDVIFNDSSTTTIGQIIKWDWNFGNGSTAVKNNANPFAIQYINANAYTISLTVTTDSGCVNILPKTIKINPLPKVAFTLPTAVCLPIGKAMFTDVSTIADNPPNLFTYLWNFGDKKDATPSTSANPTHYYSLLDSPIVTLIVTSKNGCIDSLQQALNTILPQPKAKFTVLPDSIVCIDKKIFFTDKSNGITSAVAKWFWNFGNLGTSNASNPFFIFFDSGFIPVTLHIENLQGCPSDTFKVIAKINPYPKLDLAATANFLQGGLLTIKPLYYYGNNLSYQWTTIPYTTNNFIVDDTVVNAQVFPKENTTYKLTITGEGACAVSDSINVVVLKNPIIPTAFSPNGDGINDTWEIKYLESYPGCTVSVFDRFGRIVFNRTVGYLQPWDGKMNGNPLPTGTYYYIIDPKNGRQIISGPVTILR